MPTRPAFFRRHFDSDAAASLLRGATLAGEDRVAAARTLRRADPRMDRPLVIAVGRDAAAVYGPW